MYIYIVARSLKLVLTEIVGLCIENYRNDPNTLLGCKNGDNQNNRSL